jgi:uncharacterized alkaline shock family protein YloU
MTEGQASISAEIIARYAADAAVEVGGIRKLAGRRGVRIDTSENRLRVELHVLVDWGESVPEVSRSVQARVREYLERMADLEAAVDVVVDEFGEPA